jgi:DNA cross-link repair 1A protein
MFIWIVHFFICGFSFLSRDICSTFLIERVKEYLKQDFLILIGTFSIGKEDLLFELSMKTGQTIFAESTRYESIQTLVNSGWRNSYWIRPNPKFNIHLVSLQICSPNLTLEDADKSARKKVAAF